MRQETREHIESLFDRYPQRRGALLPAIYALQAENGYVDADGARELAELFELKPVQVWEVLTFYNMFYTSPQGGITSTSARTCPAACVGAAAC